MAITATALIASLDSHFSHIPRGDGCSARGAYSRGMVWVRARGVSYAVTLPFVRRLADGLVAAFLVVQTVRPLPAHAMPEPAIPPAMVVEVAHAQEPERPHAVADRRDVVLLDLLADLPRFLLR